MAFLIVGGSTRNIGKTSVVAGVISALRERCWTAIKITQYGHGICSADGKECECATADHMVAFTEERDPDGRSDTSRYLRAGAARAVWVRTQQGELFEAMPRLRREIAASNNCIVESNSLVQFMHPDLYISVLDPAKQDLKKSARRFLDRAGLILVPEAPDAHAAWERELAPILRRAELRYLDAETYVTAAIVDFIAAKIADR